MKTLVTFREYTLPSLNLETGEKERGEFIQSFEKEFLGSTVVEINEKINDFLREHAEKEKVDIQVWGVK